MHKTRAKIGALVMALGVALALVLGGVARAAEGYEFKLTVQPTDSTSQAVKDDLTDNADVKVDVYKLADAVEDADYDTYNYDWAEGFEAVGSRFETIAANRESKASDWQELYALAAKTAGEKGLEPYFDEPQPLGEIKLTDRALYLVIAHGYVPEGEEGVDAENGYAGVAYGDYLRFSFPPTMVAAPTKWADAEGDMSGVIYTDWASGEWKDEATIVLKSSYEPLFGSLEINKVVDDFDGKPATFTFHIYDTETGGETYDNYAAISYDAQTSTTVTHIPAGLEVTVDESYDGARYKAVGPKTQNATIVSDVAAGREGGAVASVSFENAPDGDHTDGGYGIENHFDYNSETGDWDFTPRPAKAE